MLNLQTVSPYRLVALTPLINHDMVQVAFIKLLPLKIISRAWGWLNSVYLPTFLRVFVISWYARTFNCKIDEADIDDLTQYAHLGDFFRRALKPGLRPISDAAVVSPADGIVVHHGRVEDDEKIEQVKGVNYSLQSFLGPNTWSQTQDAIQHSGGDLIEEINEAKKYIHELMAKKTPNTTLYHCVIYLAPGDYHRFHSPSDWTVAFRRHFSGKLLSIRPSWMSWIADLFTINERVAYLGSWAHGFFSMTAVGATNVGSIRVYFDEVRVNHASGSFSELVE